MAYDLRINRNEINAKRIAKIKIIRILNLRI